MTEDQDKRVMQLATQYQAPVSLIAQLIQDRKIK
jgi:hypothetical protein